MGKCKKCGKSYFFSFLRGGLCKDCSEKIEEYKFLMPQWLKKANQLIGEMNQSDSPDSFFIAYDLLIKNLKRLAENEEFVQFQKQKPSETLEKMKTHIHGVTNEMIHKYHEKVQADVKKTNDIKKKEEEIKKFYGSLMIHGDKMSAINKNTVERLYSALKKEIEQ